MSKRKCKVMMVTPDVATRWLESNTHNRPIRQSLVDRYAQAMKRGEWKLTPEPIAFSQPYVDECNETLGATLIEGQHRLWAIVESGVSCEMTVWFGCEADEFEVIGQGAKRTLGDVLATTRRDLADPTLISSVCSSAGLYACNCQSKLTAPQVQTMLEAIQAEVVAVGDYKKKLRKMAPRPMLSALVLCQIVNPAMTDLIVTQLSTAVGFTERDPIRALHLYLQDCVTSSHHDTPDVQHYKVCHALAARLRGDHIRQLRITAEGLAWLRDAAKPKIGPLVMSLHNGKTPQHFYNPKIMVGDTAA